MSIASYTSALLVWGRFLGGVDRLVFATAWGLGVLMMIQANAIPYLHLGHMMASIAISECARHGNISNISM